MKNRFKLSQLLFVFSLLASFSYGGGFLALTTDHDDLNLRHEVRSALLETPEGRAHLSKSTKLENIAFEAGVDGLTEVFGNPVDFSDDQVLPVLSRQSVSVPTLGGGAKTNTFFFDVKGEGMLLVVENDFMQMPVTVVLYLKADATFVPLNKKNKLKRRLRWEAAKLESLEFEFEALKMGIIEQNRGNNSGSVGASIVAP